MGGMGILDQDDLEAGATLSSEVLKQGLSATFIWTVGL